MSLQTIREANLKAEQVGRALFNGIYSEDKAVREATRVKLHHAFDLHKGITEDVIQLAKEGATFEGWKVIFLKWNKAELVASIDNEAGEVAAAIAIVVADEALEEYYNTDVVPLLADFSQAEMALSQLDAMRDWVDSEASK